MNVKSELPPNIQTELKAHSPKPVRIYGLPFRPVGNTIVAPTYELAKCLARSLIELVVKGQHHVKNSECFVKSLQDVVVSTPDFMVSYNVISLFT